MFPIFVCNTQIPQEPFHRLVSNFAHLFLRNQQNKGVTTAFLKIPESHKLNQYFQILTILYKKHVGLFFLAMVSDREESVDLEISEI